MVKIQQSQSNNINKKRKSLLWCFLLVNTLGSSFFFSLLLRALCFKKLNDEHLQLYNALTTPFHIHLPVSIYTQLKGMKLTQCLCSRPFLRSLTHPRRQCFSTVILYAFSSPPQLKYTPTPSATPLPPRHRGHMLLMSKGIPYI